MPVQSSREATVVRGDNDSQGLFLAVSEAFEFDRSSITANHATTTEANIDPSLTVNDPTLTDCLKYKQIVLTVDRAASVTVKVYGRNDDRTRSGWTRWEEIQSFALTGDASSTNAIFSAESKRCHDLRITVTAGSGTVACKFVLRGIGG